MMCYTSNMWWGFLDTSLPPPSNFKILNWAQNLIFTVKAFYNTFPFFFFSSVLQSSQVGPSYLVSMPLFRLMFPPRTPSPIFISTYEISLSQVKLPFFFFFLETYSCPGSVHGFLGPNLSLPLEVAMWSRPGPTELLVYFVGFIRREVFPFRWCHRATNKGSFGELVSILPQGRSCLNPKQVKSETAMRWKAAFLWHHLAILDPNAPEAGYPQIFLRYLSQFMFPFLLKLLWAGFLSLKTKIPNISITQNPTHNYGFFQRSPNSESFLNFKRGWAFFSLKSPSTLVKSPSISPILHIEQRLNVTAF